MGGGEREDVPIKDARQEDPGPVLVLRALKSRGNVYRIDGGMAELDEILEDDRIEIGDARRESIGEIFVAGIEPGKDGGEHTVPDGYGENGIWVRGDHDYTEPRVPGAIGTGLWSTMIAWVGEATWVERRIRFVDVRRQVAKVRAENSRLFSRDEIERWRDIEEDVRFRYVSWIGARGLDGPRHAPPLRMRLRCWYEVVIGTAKGRARFMRTSEPSSVEGIEKYLGSGMIRGIGPVYARKLVRAFGEKVFDVIEAEPERLREVTGMPRPSTRARARSIRRW